MGIKPFSILICMNENGMKNVCVQKAVIEMFDG